MDKFSWTPYGQPKDFWWTEITNDFFKMPSGISKGPLLVIPTEGVPRSPLKISQGYPEGPRYRRIEDLPEGAHICLND